MSATLTSVILATDAWQTIVPVIESLDALTCRRQLEIVIVIPATEAAAVDRRLVSGFGGYVIVSIDSVIPLGRARAEGIRRATSDLVFVGETHSFPREGVFEALHAAHGLGCTVAVPAFENANPDGAVSWAGFIAGYASWTGGRPAGVLSNAPTFNVSYLKSFLAELGADLELAMTEGEDMIGRLRAGGHEVRFEPTARIGHANMSSALRWLHQRYLAGRVIAGNRSRAWRGVRRAVFALAAPLIPAVLYSRHRDGISRSLRAAERSLAHPVLILGMFAQAAGELAGYSAGVGRLVRYRYDRYELRGHANARPDPCKAAIP